MMGEKFTKEEFFAICAYCGLEFETQAAIDAYVQSMDDCFVDTADCDATMALARNTGTETDLETIFEKLAKLNTVPMATGKSRDPVVFMLDSLGALEDKK